MKKERDYSKGIIYAIKNHVNNKIYVGSTTLTKEVRFSYHKGSMYQPEKQDCKLYKAMREIGFEHFYIELIEEYPCDNVEQLERREGYWQRELDSYNNGYNSQIAGRSKKEYKEETQYNRKYYEKNKEELLNQANTYYKENKDTVKEKRKNYYYDNHEKSLGIAQKYRQANSQVIAEKMRDYRLKHKDEMNEKRREKVECECGKIVCKGALTRHKKTQYHMSLNK